jgi:hypothetical protein
MKAEFVDQRLLVARPIVGILKFIELFNNKSADVGRGKTTADLVN